MLTTAPSRLLASLDASGPWWTQAVSPTSRTAPHQFPDHPVRPSEGQKCGLNYKAADGSLIPNEGETTITHAEPDGELYDFVFQNARVHCPIISVRYLVTRECIVFLFFHKKLRLHSLPFGQENQCCSQRRCVLCSLERFTTRVQRCFWEKVYAGQT